MVYFTNDDKMALTTTWGLFMSQGTITLTKGSKTVTGAGTAFLSEIGKVLVFARIDGNDYTGKIAAFNSNTVITLKDNWAGPTKSGATYELIEAHDPRSNEWPYYWHMQLQGGGDVQLAFRSEELQFGNGYGQNIADGPNAETKQFPVQFVGLTTDKWCNPKLVYNFLRGHFVKPFVVTAPDGETGLFVVERSSLSYTDNGHLTATVSATLKTAIGFVR
ncbi:putative minor tail protein [Escherichia phage JLBYU60]|uniref:Minor tail protein n=3 Tax=Dhillonvirus TaxID=1623289 RepID=A0AAE8YZM6_9CAUD|nr:putative minor tail protein [Escherichia phage JLBYU60]UGO55276.1 putative minor tail protein [Escherichia phage JLBYU60]